MQRSPALQAPSPALLVVHMNQWVGVKVEEL